MDANDPIDILARTIWAEARGEGERGMEAVACVVMNRVARPGWWGRAVEEVCLKPWQFSCWNADDPNLPKLKAVTPDDPQFAAALGIARQAVEGSLVDITNGATSYYAAGTLMPVWARGKTPCATIGRHLFFNDIH